MHNPVEDFVHDKSDYTRDLNIKGNYYKQSAFFLSHSTGRPYEECLAYVQEVTGEGGKLQGKNPRLLCLYRPEPGMRERQETTFMDYLEDVHMTGRIMAPTMTVIKPPAEKESLLSKYIKVNLHKRKVVKKQKFKEEQGEELVLKQMEDAMDAAKKAEIKPLMKNAKTEADRKELESKLQDTIEPSLRKELDGKLTKHKAMAAYNHILQSTYKIKNNSISGAHASSGTILYNRSSHPILTSTCMCTTTYANSNNERFIAGNRHYWHPNIVYSNIIAILQSMDYNAIQHCIEQYNLTIPTVDDVFNSVKYCTDKYWKSTEDLAKIKTFIATLSDIERTGYHYAMNFAALRDLNGKLVRSFLDRLTTVHTEPVEDPDQYFKLMDGDMGCYVGVLCSDVLEGVNIWDCKDDKPEAYMKVCSTLKAIYIVFSEFALLIKTFWSIKSLPSSVAGFRNSLRDVVPVSDTDSSIFTLMHWVEWFFGELVYNQKGLAITALMTYIVSNVTAHLLNQFSANLGVPEKDMGIIAMKNEFLFPTLILTPRAKHYASYIIACEGTVYSKPKLETKGVTLKSSKNPKHIIDASDDFIRRLMNDVMDNKKLSIVKILKEVADMERGIKDSIMNGSIEYLSTIQIKPKDGYKDPMRSNYIHYELWERTLSAKYGNAPIPTYLAVKVSLDLPNAKAVNAWLETIEDLKLRELMVEWLIETGRNKKLTQVMLPVESIIQGGIPVEFRNIVNVRKVIYTLMESFYLILESLGIFMFDKHLTKLVSDYY